MREETNLVRLGRVPGMDNISQAPVYRASAVTFPSFATYESRHENRFVYGGTGTPTQFALADAIAELEGGGRTLVVSSGKAAITHALLPLLKSGDHILVLDATYRPTHAFCEGTLRRFGVETTYFAPSVGERIAELFRPNTRVVFFESPSSGTFEMVDVPAVARAAHAKGITVVMDNTWATPLGFKPLAHGVDVSITAGTKCVVGHADALIGFVTCAEERHYVAIRAGLEELGDTVSADACYLALRGLRTMAVRMAHQQRTAQKLAGWLVEQPAVGRLFYPPLPSDPGHAIYARDYRAGAALFAVSLKVERSAVARMIDRLRVFRIGTSWGGCDSLIVPMDPVARPWPRWDGDRQGLRIHVGLEDVRDLVEDLARAFEVFGGSK